MQCSETGDYGYAKPREIWQEKVASDLARQIEVPVPEVRLGEVEGQSQICAVSIVFGDGQTDLRSVREGPGGVTQNEKDALALASGIIALHAWLGTGDLKEEHIVVAQGSEDCRAAAIDFASAFSWRPDGGDVSYPGGEPKGLVENLDRSIVKSAVEAIEGLTDGQITATVEAVPDPPLTAEEKRRIITGLINRRNKVREALKSRGWLP